MLAPSLSNIAFALSQNSVTASVVVPTNCITQLSNTLINFGVINPLGNAPTANAVLDTNEGNVAAFILLDGTNWVSGGNSFPVTNTIWDFSTHAGGVSGNALQLLGAVTNTANIIGSGVNNILYFGALVNNGITQPAGTYTQTITIENEC